MNFQEYQEKSRKTAQYPAIGDKFVYPALGLANEAGEVAGKIKKIFRDDGGKVTPERLHKIEEEMGDVLWYLAQLATDLDLSLDEIADKNLTKLMSRLERDLIHGDGDNR